MNSHDSLQTRVWNIICSKFQPLKKQPTTSPY